MSLLDTDCLKINKNWVPVSVITVRKAFSDAYAGAVTFLRFEDGYPIPITLEDWLKIEATDDEESILTGVKHYHTSRRIRVPRVCITTKFDRIISKEQKCTTNNLLKRYKGKDAVTGKKLTPERVSREHVRPRSKGGSDGWHNEVPMDRDLNSRRGNKSYRKLGLRKPKLLGAPPPVMPIHYIKNLGGHTEWDYFKIPRVS